MAFILFFANKRFTCFNDCTALIYDIFSQRTTSTRVKPTRTLSTQYKLLVHKQLESTAGFSLSVCVPEAVVVMVVVRMSLGFAFGRLQ